MMKQAEKISAAAVTPPSVVREVIVLDEERMEVLMKTGGEEKVMLRSDKTKLIKQVLENSSDILSTACIVDVAIGCDLSTRMKQLIPKSRDSISKATNKVLAKWILDLFDPFQLLHTHLLDQNFCTAGEKLTRTKKKKKTGGSLVLSLAEQFVNLRDKIDRKVIVSRQNDENPLSKWMCKLSDAQRDRTFSVERIPTDPNHRRCLVCGNLTINEPEENKQVLKYNQELDRNYKLKMEVWNNYVKSNEEFAGQDRKKNPFPVDPTNPSKTMKRMPVRSPYKSQILQCMASTSKCVMRNSDSCSTCPIWCVNPKTGLRYEFTDKCQFPVCQSTCTAAY